MRKPLSHGWEMTEHHWIGDDHWLRSDRRHAPFGAEHLSLPFRHFGLLHLAKERGRSQLTWDIDHVGPDTLKQARAWLARRPSDEETTLCFFKHGWQAEIFNSPKNALERFDALPRFRGVELLNLAIYDRRPLSSLKKAVPRLQRAYDAAPEAREIALIIGPNEDGELVYKHVGEQTPARRFFGKAWAERAVGARFDSVLDDQGYEASTLPAYLEALESGKPIYHHVRASIERPGREAVWCNMQRLVLPLPGNQLHVTVAMTQRSEIPFLT